MKTNPVRNNSLADQEEHLFQVMSGQRFLKMEGLANEVPFFIYAFDPTQSIEVSKGRDRIINRLRSEGISVREINLYEISIGVLQKTKALERLLEQESSLDKGAVLEVLQNLLEPQHRLAPAIAEELEANDAEVIILTGVGEVFPFIRSHNVLNNLQSVIRDKPMLMYFPGKYEQSATLGSALVLFGELTDDQYYRAKDILEQEP